MHIDGFDFELDSCSHRRTHSILTMKLLYKLLDEKGEPLFHLDFLLPLGYLQILSWKYFDSENFLVDLSVSYVEKFKILFDSIPEKEKLFYFAASDFGQVENIKRKYSKYVFSKLSNSYKVLN